MNVQVYDRVIETDEEGYLINRDDWREEFAEQMAMLQADADDVKLTETLWGLIHYFRDYYNENKQHPSMHNRVLTLGKHHGEHVHEEKAYEKFLYGIFPHGPVQELCKLAGLPKPSGDIE